MPALSEAIVDIDDDVSGLSWNVENFDELARLIALISLGQIRHAAKIIRNLGIGQTDAAFFNTQLFSEAKNQLQIRGSTDEKRASSMYHRDGFLFECISWIVARQTTGTRIFLKDPHISSTTQGLDGLKIEMHPTEAVVLQTTIFEDKCTDNPRAKFRDEVLPSFTQHHEGKRSPDLVANATALISQDNLDDTAATQVASMVLDLALRSYRAALTVDASFSSAAKRKALFKGYASLGNMAQRQRLGAVFVIDGDLRVWFQALADAVINALDEFEARHV